MAVEDQSSSGNIFQGHKPLSVRERLGAFVGEHAAVAYGRFANLVTGGNRLDRSIRQATPGEVFQSQQPTVPLGTRHPH